MKKAFWSIFVFFLIQFFPRTDVSAQITDAPVTQSRYRSLKTWQEQAWSEAQTREEKLNIFRETVRRGRFSGDPRLNRMFDNFDGDFSFNPDLPGLRTAVRLSASENRNVVRGSVRTLRYAGVLNGDNRFELTSLNGLTKTLSGKTDSDIEFRHRGTGRIGRIEVKELSPETQRRNIRKIELQIKKMAEDRRDTGRMQVWINRRRNIPEIEALGRRYGITVYGDIATGRVALKDGQPSLRLVLDHLDHQVRMRMAVSGGAQLGFGLFQVVASGSEAWSELQTLIDNDRIDMASLIRLGQHLSMTAAGMSFSFSGSVQVAQSFGSVSKLARLSRWSGRLGIGLTLVAGGFVAWQYQNGQLTDRAFNRSWVSMGGGVVLGAGGAWGGALTGAAVGSMFGPAGTAVGGLVGGLAGGFGGGWLGSQLASQGLENYYTIKNQRMENERVADIYSLYDLN